MTDILSRLARLEAKVEANIEHFKQNDMDHAAIMEKLHQLDSRMLSWSRVVYAVGATIGTIAGIIINYWEFLTHKLGH